MRKKGFTLIELMVVIAIIAILAAIALTSYKAYVRKAKAKELVTFARACIQEAVAQCMTDNSTDPSTLDACQDPADTEYITNIDITPPSDCSSFTTTVTGKVDSVDYEVKCTYNATTEDVVCSAPHRKPST